MVLKSCRKLNLGRSRPLSFRVTSEVEIFFGALKTRDVFIEKTLDSFKSTTSISIPFIFVCVFSGFLGWFQYLGTTGWCF